MSFEPPAGILDIGNATLRVGKLEVTETTGLNQGLQNIVKNDLLLTETAEYEYSSDKHWGLKLPTTWVAEFEVKGETDKYVEFNFYNEGSTSNAYGYTLNFRNTTLTLKFDENELSPGYPGSPATIPTIVGTFRKVNVFLERGVIAVYIDGARALYYKFGDGYNANLGVPERVISTTGSAFLNLFIEANSSSAAFKNLRIVNGRFISDKTSNVSFIGSLGVGVNNPKESLDIRGNMHLTRVSNVSQISVDSNVVTEYTGPHDRPLRKYPEVALTADAQLSAGGYKGYIVNQSSFYEGSTAYAWQSFAGNQHWLSSGTAFDGGDDVFNDTNGPWISIQLPTKIKLEYLEFYIGSGRPGQTVAGGSVYASNDGSNWTNIGSLDNLGNYTDTAPAHVKFTHTTRYDRYLLHVTSVSLYTYAHIERLSLYGYEEGSGSLDTTLKTVYNVPATTGTQLEIYYDAKGESTVQSPIPDLSPNTNTGALSTSPPTLDTTDGIESFKFDASSSQNITSTIDTSYWGTNKLHSVAFWFKADRIDGKYNIFHIGNPSNNESSGFWISDGKADNNAGNSLNWWFYGGDSGTKVSSFSWTLNTWYHIALTFDGSTKKMYVNGHHIDFSVGNVITTLPTGIPNSASLAVGSTTNSVDYFDGSIANFRVYGAKVLNADQVKELYDYQKDYFFGTKSQVTLYKGHLGVGVTEPSGQLELAGDERIQEYPPRALTNHSTYIEGHGVFKAYASKTTYNPWNAFNDATDVWYSDSESEYNGDYSGSTQLAPETVKGEYLILEMPYEIVIKQTKFWQQINGNHVWDRGVYYAKRKSSDEWTPIHNVTDRPADDDTPYVAYITDPHPYKYFAIVPTRRYTAHATNGVSIRNFQIFGTPGPTTLDKGSLSLTRSLDVPRVSRYDVDTETPRPEKLLVDFDTTHFISSGNPQGYASNAREGGVFDSSGKGNHGRYYGGTGPFYSYADKAFVFDGSNDLIDIPSVSGVGTGAWVHSKSFWFKLHSSTDPGVLFLLGRNSDTKQIAVQSNGSGQFQYYIYGCNSRVQVNGSDWFPEVNRWYHCVTVFKNNETTTLGNPLTGREMYIDGVKQTLIATNTQVALNLDSSQVRFGNQFNSNYLDFELSNPKLYSVALEPSEVRKLYKLGRTGRSMVISDTAVGIGKVPETQLDVRGAISCNAIYTGMVAILKPYVYTFGTGVSVMTWDTDATYGADYGLFNVTQGDAELNLPYKGTYFAAMKLNSQSTGNGIIQVYCEYLNDAATTWLTWNNSEDNESSWNGSHELNFSFTMDTRKGFRWRFRFYNGLSNTFEVANNQVWSRLVIFKIA